MPPHLGSKFVDSPKRSQDGLSLLGARTRTYSSSFYYYFQCVTLPGYTVTHPTVLACNCTGRTKDATRQKTRRGTKAVRCAGTIAHAVAAIEFIESIGIRRKTTRN